MKTAAHQSMVQHMNTTAHQIMELHTNTVIHQRHLPAASGLSQVIMHGNEVQADQLLDCLLIDSGLQGQCGVRRRSCVRADITFQIYHVPQQQHAGQSLVRCDSGRPKSYTPDKGVYVTYAGLGMRQTRD